MTASPRPASRPAAPLTWFAPRNVGERDPDQVAFLTLGAAMVVLAAPVVVLGAAIVYLSGRATGARWWWPVVAGMVTGVIVAVTYGPEGLAARYVAGYRHLFEAGGGVVGLPGALRHGWVALAGALAPLSVPLSLLSGGCALGYATLRRPRWRTEDRKEHNKATGDVAGNGPA